MQYRNAISWAIVNLVRDVTTPTAQGETAQEQFAPEKVSNMSKSAPKHNAVCIIEFEANFTAVNCDLLRNVYAVRK